MMTVHAGGRCKSLHDIQAASACVVALIHHSVIEVVAVIFRGFAMFTSLDLMHRQKLKLLHHLHVKMT